MSSTETFLTSVLTWTIALVQTVVGTYWNAARFPVHKVVPVVFLTFYPLFVGTRQDEDCE